MTRSTLLYDPDAEASGGANVTDETPAPAGTPPPAAATVAEGTVTEDTLRLKEELERERQARRKAETDAAHFQDEARRLKEAGLNTPQTVPVMHVDKRSALEKFMSGEEVD